jgi:hypothetical protein
MIVIVGLVRLIAKSRGRRLPALSERGEKHRHDAEDYLEDRYFR